MAWSRGWRRVGVVVAGLGAGAALYYVGRRSTTTIPTPSAYASWTTNFEPNTKWDINWDHRDPQSCVRPSRGTIEDDNRFNEEIDVRKPHAVRHLFLIRHGQYNTNGATDKHMVLTELGRKQAEFTGQRLNELGFEWNDVVRSTMTRAQETAQIIEQQLDRKVPCSNCTLLEEGAPIPPDPPVGHWRPEAHFFQEGARIEAAFRKHIHRASPKQKNNSYTIIVCHANVIRYFVCRALQLPPEAWLRISLNHGSITHLTIHPSGRVILRALGDTGHMNPKDITSQ